MPGRAGMRLIRYCPASLSNAPILKLAISDLLFGLEVRAESPLRCAVGYILLYKRPKERHEKRDLHCCKSLKSLWLRGPDLNR